MAATKQQGRSYGLFLVGLTVLCAGIYDFSGGLGKLAALLGVAILAVTFWRFLSIKPLEGKIALGSQPAGMKLAGVAVTLLGWVVILFGLHITASVGGRLVTSCVGLVVSLAGVCFILPAACNKNAIWKP